MLIKLAEIIDQIPAMEIDGKLYSPVFRYGTREQLSEDLSLQRKTGEKYYPLIYLETPIESTENPTFRFIIATLNKRTDMRNKDRAALTFKYVLEPLRAQLTRVLLRSGIFKRTLDTPKNDFNGEYHFNYHITPDIWDALVYETSFRFTPDCNVRTIQF